MATGLDGTFLLRGLAEGAVLVQARDLCHEPQTLTSTLLPGTTHVLDFRLAPSGRELNEVMVTGKSNRKSAQSARSGQPATCSTSSPATAARHLTPAPRSTSCFSATSRVYTSGRVMASSYSRDLPSSGYLGATSATPTTVRDSVDIT